MRIKKKETLNPDEREVLLVRSNSALGNEGHVTYNRDSERVSVCVYILESLCVYDEIPKRQSFLTCT